MTKKRKFENNHQENNINNNIVEISESNNINHILPHDLIYQIFTAYFNDKKNLLNLNMVCKLWGDIVERIFAAKLAKLTRTSMKAIFFNTKANLKAAANTIFELLTETKIDPDNSAPEHIDFPDVTTKDIEGSFSAMPSSYFSRMKAAFNGNTELSVLNYMYNKNYDLSRKGSFDQTLLHLLAYTNNKNTLRFLIEKIGLDINQKDSVFGFCPIVWRILGAAYFGGILFSLEIGKLLVDENTGVDYIFDPDLSEIDDSYLEDEIPLSILHNAFKNLNTPETKHEHYQFLALLANNYKDDEGKQRVFVTPLVKAGYTKEDVQQICIELRKLQPAQPKLPTVEYKPHPG